MASSLVKEDCFLSTDIQYPTQNGRNAHWIGVMDYPNGDPAMADISGQAVNWFKPENQTWFTVDNFSAIEIGFNLATREVFWGSRIHPFTVVCANAAPRSNGNKNLEAAPFVTFLLRSGIRVFTTLNAGAEEIEMIGLEAICSPIYKVNIQTDGTQFRSLYLPEYSARFYLEGEEKVVDTSYDYTAWVKDELAKIKPIRIAHVDSFGNIKLTCFKDDPKCPKVGEKIKVSIGGVIHKIYRGRHMGDSNARGAMCLHPGSSVTNQDRNLMEISLIGTSAAYEFKNQGGIAKEGFRPRSGQEVQFLT